MCRDHVVQVMSIFTNWTWVGCVAKYMFVFRLLHLMQIIKTKKHYLTPGGGGGYLDILIHLRYVGWAHFFWGGGGGGYKSLNLIFLEGGGQKMIYGMKTIWIFFFFFFFFFLGGGGGHQVTGLFLLSLGLLCILEPFLKVNVPNGIFFVGEGLKFLISFGICLIFFRVTVDAGSKLTCIYTM